MRRQIGGGRRRNRGGQGEASKRERSHTTPQGHPNPTVNTPELWRLLQSRHIWELFFIARDTSPPTLQLDVLGAARAREGAEDAHQSETVQRVDQWLLTGPYAGAVNCKASCDLRSGGTFYLVMSSEESSREVSGAYLQHRPAAQLVFTWSDPQTNDVNTLVTVELNPRGDETDLVLTHERLPTSAICEGHTRGW
jgi:hypothetical protein